MRRVSKTSWWMGNAATLTAAALAFAGCSGGGGSSKGSTAAAVTSGGQFSGGIAGMSISPPGDLTLDAPGAMSTGQQFQLIVDVYDANDNTADYTRAVTIESSNSQVVSVDQTGLVSAVGVGTAQLSVSVPSYTGRVLTATKQVTVVAPSGGIPTYRELKVYPLARTLQVSQQQQMVVVATDDTGRMWDVTRSLGAQVLDFSDPQANPLPPSMAASLGATGLLTAQAEGRAVVLSKIDNTALMAGSNVVIGTGLARPLGPTDLFNAGALSGSSNPIDVTLVAELQRVGASPAQLSGDGEFLRRVYSDALGRRPTEAEASAFLSDASATKREALINSLVGSAEFNDFWGKRLGELFLITDNTFDGWARDQLASGQTLPQIISQLAQGTGTGGTLFDTQHATAAERVEILMLAGSGLTAKCLRCHGHPLSGPNDGVGRMTFSGVQDDRYKLDAFFAMTPDDATKLDKFNNRVGAPLEPGWPLETGVNVTSTLATDLATRRAEFAQIYANSTVLARGMSHRLFADVIQPLLDPNQFLAANLDKVLVPTLLDSLTQLFKSQNGSLQGFLSEVFKSKTYQLSAAHTTDQFDGLMVRRVLERDHSEAVESMVLNVTGAQVDPNLLGFFRTSFGYPLNRLTIDERRHETNMSQALVVLNSPAVQASLVNGGTVAGLATAVDGGQMTMTQALTTLWRSSLSRDPDAGELSDAMLAVTSAGSTRAGLEDVGAVLMATVEAMAN